MKKYPLNKFVLDDSEDYPEGMTLIMRIRENKNRTSESWDCHIIMWEVHYNEKWIITESSSKSNTMKPISMLKQHERRLAIESLLKHGIRNDTK